MGFFFIAYNLTINLNQSSVFVLHAIILETKFVKISDTTAACISCGGLLFLFIIVLFVVATKNAFIFSRSVFIPLFFKHSLACRKFRPYFHNG
jgi:hypothetical protein